MREPAWLGVTSIDEALPFRWRGHLRSDPELAESARIRLRRRAPARHRPGGREHRAAAPDLGRGRPHRPARPHPPAPRHRARPRRHRPQRVDHPHRARPPRRAPRTPRRRRHHEPPGPRRRTGRPRDAAAGDAVPQRAAGRAARGLTPRLAHLAATAGAVTDPGTHFGMVRIGAGLYGIDPSHTIELRGAMTLTRSRHRGARRGGRHRCRVRAALPHRPAHAARAAADRLRGRDPAQHLRRGRRPRCDGAPARPARPDRRNGVDGPARAGRRRCRGRAR